VLGVSSAGWKLAMVVSAMADDDQFVSDLVAAVEVGVGVEDYLGCRDAGAGHDEIVGVCQIGGGGYLKDYALLRRVGAGHDDAGGVLLSGLSTEVYVSGVEAGCSHDELMVVFDRCVGRSQHVEGYIMGRVLGYCHLELLGTRDRYDLWPGVYARARQAGVKRWRLRRCRTKSWMFGNYLEAREIGDSHRQAVAAAKASIYCQPGFNMYIEERSAKVSHRQALRDLSWQMAIVEPIELEVCSNCKAKHV
jgi:hypothetical protein